MNKQMLLDIGAKSLSISAAITTLGVGGGLMIAFCLCFIQQTSFRLPFNIVEIVTEQDGGGYYTSIMFANSLFYAILILFLIISVLVFCIFYVASKNKQVNK